MIKKRSGEAQAAQHRKAGPMKHRLTPRGGSQKDEWDYDEPDIKLSRCTNHNKAECPTCGTYAHFGDDGDPCIVNMLSSRACIFGTKSCVAEHK